MRSGQLVVIEDLGMREVGGHRISYVRVQCDCGQRRDVRATHLTKGQPVSCGCQSRAIFRAALHRAPQYRPPPPRHDTPAVLLAPLPKKPPVRVS
jgi:hypothetical protein